MRGITELDKERLEGSPKIEESNQSDQQQKQQGTKPKKKKKKKKKNNKKKASVQDKLDELLTESHQSIDLDEKPKNSDLDTIMNGIEEFLKEDDNKKTIVTSDEDKLDVKVNIIDDSVDKTASENNDEPSIINDINDQEVEEQGTPGNIIDEPKDLARTSKSQDTSEIENSIDKDVNEELGNNKESSTSSVSEKRSDSNINDIESEINELASTVLESTLKAEIEIEKEDDILLAAVKSVKQDTLLCIDSEYKEATKKTKEKQHIEIQQHRDVIKKVESDVEISHLAQSAEEESQKASLEESKPEDIDPDVSFEKKLESISGEDTHLKADGTLAEDEKMIDKSIMEPEITMDNDVVTDDGTERKDIKEDSFNICVEKNNVTNKKAEVKTLNTDMTEIKTEVETEIKTEAETEVKAEVETKVKTEVKAEVKAKIKEEVKEEVDSEVKEEAESEIKSVENFKPKDSADSKEEKEVTEKNQPIKANIENETKELDVNQLEDKESDVSENKKAIKVHDSSLKVQSDVNEKDVSLKSIDAANPSKPVGNKISAAICDDNSDQKIESREVHESQVEPDANEELTELSKESESKSGRDHVEKEETEKLTESKLERNVSDISETQAKESEEQEEQFDADVQSVKGPGEKELEKELEEKELEEKELEGKDGTVVPETSKSTEEESVEVKELTKSDKESVEVKEPSKSDEESVEVKEPSKSDEEPVEVKEPSKSDEEPVEVKESSIPEDEKPQDSELSNVVDEKFEMVSDKSDILEDDSSVEMETAKTQQEYIAYIEDEPKEDDLDAEPSIESSVKETPIESELESALLAEDESSFSDDHFTEPLSFGGDSSEKTGETDEPDNKSTEDISKKTKSLEDLIDDTDELLKSLEFVNDAELEDMLLALDGKPTKKVNETKTTKPLATKSEGKKETMETKKPESTVIKKSEIREQNLKEPIYIYTSLAGGGFHMIPRTNRLTTILTANKIEFTYRDLGTDDEARKVWKLYGRGRTLPGIVRGRDDIIGNWEEIEEANEDYRLHELIYDTI
ncbi:hypothetical protein Kpol_1069p15 [Vanderwaltozyma polyspora DSM 70294]|uniref:Uncharacterized protein n=1 Tax=Vanderwaltozyma polyspora (strain ATCC 22028 / DSM 70294 / BCRC 21397 / CBS 2163 / NBRC 10782 / NRRL Y-8283 / UCD 57-17) TaxID=436907 RepID=A7TRC4_VANPO|nr:uncharacterized protein Kpol_1069p15 [Vanderwaltozyma polyspora DSM 70294]EDO15192.1 hypothetical protein Kpol_1069p15 [Vanderwaltozyma polyspora DSM 70294]